MGNVMYYGSMGHCKTALLMQHFVCVGPSYALPTTYAGYWTMAAEASDLAVFWNGAELSEAGAQE